ncbi:MAG TPA: ATP-binding protein [Solirubrobacterales bacterium]
MSEAIQILVSWPLVASMAAALTAQSLRAGRRRGALNEALHELRRPLQALALVSGSAVGSAAAGDSVRLAAAALERLEREVNGERSVPAVAAIACEPLIHAAVERWKSRASLAGATLGPRCALGAVVVAGDRTQLAQALDNLIVNAIEHGGPAITVEAHRRRDRVRVAVIDSGRDSRPESRRGTPAETIARLTGKRRRGHGLNVVRRVAADHGGRFALRRSPLGSVAVLELPLVAGELQDGASRLAA